MKHVILYFLFDNPETIKKIQNKSTLYGFSILDPKEVSSIVAVENTSDEKSVASISNWKYRVEFSKNLPSTVHLFTFGSNIVKDFVKKEKLSIILRILEGFELEWIFMSTTNLDNLSTQELLIQIANAKKCN